MTVTVLRADARSLPLADASVHAVVCDPPYGLGFMGREWDAFGGRMMRDETRVVQLASGAGWTAKPYGASGKSAAPVPGESAAFQEFSEQWAREAYRVLKPGGWLLAFGGTRTWHRLCCGVEDAGFEIRDTITWLYGSGFPKSLDVSKAIDKTAGAEREVIGPNLSRHGGGLGVLHGGGIGADVGTITAPATDDARRWAGWGTALKPASEPIVVARKPLAGTVAQNVQAHGTGALNIDACRVGMSQADAEAINHKHAGMDADRYERPAGSSLNLSVNPMPLKPAAAHSLGRWPSNVVLSHVRAWDGTDACAEECMPGCPVAELDRQSGAVGANSVGHLRRSYTYEQAGQVPSDQPFDYADSGGASRFFPTFRYQAKAPSRERPRVNGKAHETVKPLSLMRWLVRLVTPPGGIVLDPFAGSGTTAEAALLEGFDCVTCDLELSHLPLIAARTRRSTGVAVDVPLFHLEGA